MCSSAWLPRAAIATVRRLVHAAAVLAAVSLLTFALADAAPGDAFSDLALDPSFSSRAVSALRSDHSLEAPFLERYARWAASAARGDFGTSITYGLPVAALLGSRIGSTVLLGAAALALAWVTALPLGILAAARRGTVADRIAGWGTSAMLGFPDALLAIAALWIALASGAFPTGGMTSLDAEALPLAARARDIVWHLALPAAATAAAMFPVIFRHVRGSLIESLRTPYVSAAAARGVPPTRLLFVHALRLSASTLVTLGGLTFGGLLSIALIVEVVTGWPGLGPLLLEAIQGRDIPVVAGCMVASAACVVLSNAMADIVVSLADARVEAA